MNLLDYCALWDTNYLQVGKSLSGWEDPLEEGMAAHSSILPGESHGQKSLAGHSPWGRKEWDMNQVT